MIQVKFKNLEKSELAIEAVTDRLQVIIDKFSELSKSKIFITLEMENSPTKPGPDLFNVKMRIAGGRFDGVNIAKSNSNLYIALANLVEHLLEKFNRLGDKDRVRKRTMARNLSNQIQQLDIENE